MPVPFLDANVLLRHLAADHPDHSPRSSNLIDRIERGEVRARISEIVIFETVFTLDRTYRLPRETIRDAVGSLLGLPGIVIPGKRDLLRALDLFVEHRLPFGDAHILIVMERDGLTEIVTFDREFDRVPGIVRREPS